MNYKKILIAVFALSIASSSVNAMAKQEASPNAIVDQEVEYTIDPEITYTRTKLEPGVSVYMGDMLYSVTTKEKATVVDKDYKHKLHLLVKDIP